MATLLPVPICRVVIRLLSSVAFAMLDHATFERLKDAIQVACGVLSLVVNSFLIFLIITKSSKSMGNYRYLMVYFCICSMFFSALDIVVRPVMTTYKTSFYIFIDLRNRDISFLFGKLLIATMAGIFGVVIYGISIHFLYRYFALERNERTKYFDAKYLPFWFSIPILGGACWTAVSFFLLYKTDEFETYIRTEVEERFGADVNQIELAGVQFFLPQPDGGELFNWQSGVGFLCYGIIMIIPFTFIIRIGKGSRDEIRKLPASMHGKNFQMQLYRALVAQTLIPVVMLFLPFSIIFIFPFFHIDCASFANCQTFVYALYPAVDSIPSFFFIESYRNAVTGYLTCKKGSCHAAARDVSEGNPGEVLP